MKIFTFISLLLISIIGVSQQDQPNKIENPEFKVITHYQLDIKHIESPADIQLAEFRSQIDKFTQSSNSRATKKALDSIIFTNDNNLEASKTEYAYDYNGNHTKYINFTKDTVSNTWISDSKILQTYDGSNLLTSYLFENRTGRSQWFGYSNMTYSYNFNRDMTQVIAMAWDTTTNQWINGYEYNYEYNSNFDLIKATTKKWNQSTNLWEEIEKEERSYNGSQLVLSIISIWDPITNSLVIETSQEYIYDAIGNVESIKYSNWNTSTSQWVNNLLEDYSFDTDENQTLFMRSLWDTSTNQWMKDLKWENTYDINGLLTSEIRSLFNQSSNTWMKSLKYENSFNASLQFTGSITYLGVPATNQWRKDYKREINFNAQNLVTSYFTFDFDTISNNWKLVFKDIYQYDGNFNMTFREFMIWSYHLNEWEGKVKNEYTFDVNKNITSQTFYSWDIQNVTWILYSKHEQVFNNSNDRIELTRFLWNGTSTTWDFDGKQVATMDESFSKNELLLPSNRDYSYNSMVILEKSEQWDINSNSWNNTENRTYHYSDQVVNSIIDAEENSILVFPNPFSNSIRFKLEEPTTSYTLDIYDAQGKKVLSKQITNNQTVNTEILSTGLYLYTLTFGNEILKGKIIKQ